ncbi:MAG: DUF3126 family protein [Hyphomicrobiaceae bacterium]
MAGTRGAAKASALTKGELQKLQAHLRKLFGNKTIELRARQRAADAAEFYVGEEFVGVVSKELEEGETSYQLSISILDFDLEEDA